MFRAHTSPILLFFSLSSLLTSSILLRRAHKGVKEEEGAVTIPPALYLHHPLTHTHTCSLRTQALYEPLSWVLSSRQAQTICCKMIAHFQTTLRTQVCVCLGCIACIQVNLYGTLKLSSVTLDETHGAWWDTLGVIVGYKSCRYSNHAPQHTSVTNSSVECQRHTLQKVTRPQQSHRKTE